MKFKMKISVQPITIFIVTMILLSMFSVFALIEFTQTRKEILSIMENEGLVLLDALMAGTERSILAYEEVETQLQNRLLNGARAVEAMDRFENLTPARLDALCERLNVFRIQLLNQSGVLEKSSRTGNGLRFEQDSSGTDWILPLLVGKEEEIVTGFGEGQINTSRYAVGVRRRSGGAVIVAADTDDLLALRREVGPGRFIQEIAGRPGMVYMVLQDSLGIRMASRGVKTLGAIVQDPFLFDLYHSGGQASRITSFNDQNVFEIVASFIVDNHHLGLFRIGLNMTAFQNMIRSARIRMILIAVSLVFLGIVGFGLVMTTQNVRTLSESYLQVKTHTGEILQNLKDAVIAADGGGVITVFNRAAESIFELPRESVISRSICDIEGCYFQFLADTLKTGSEIRAEENRCLINNQMKILRLNTSVIRNSDGLIDSAILIATEITHQWELEAQLRRQEKLQAMGALASGVAHEVRNPINAIGMIAQRFRKEFKPETGVEEYRLLTETMHQEVRRIDRIIQQFLEFGRPPSLQRRLIPVKKLLDEVSAVFISSAVSSDVKFNLHVIHDEKLYLDADQMKQVLLNLLRNSLEACRAGDEIRVSGVSAGTDYIIHVEDTGKGISQDALSRIFDLYYTTKPEGTGIGLTMVAQIVQAHGGTVTVESGSGEVTRFILRFPKPAPET